MFNFNSEFLKGYFSNLGTFIRIYEMYSTETENLHEHYLSANLQNRLSNDKCMHKHVESITFNS
jgi:hypothetical protein